MYLKIKNLFLLSLACNAYSIHCGFQGFLCNFFKIEMNQRYTVHHIAFIRLCSSVHISLLNNLEKIILYK